MSIQPIDLPVLGAAACTKSAAPSSRLAALSNVNAELTIVAGRATSKVGEILSMKEGTVLTLTSPLNAPFDVMLGETVVARGELVAVGDQFGVRIVEVAEGLVA